MAKSALSWGGGRQHGRAATKKIVTVRVPWRYFPTDASHSGLLTVCSTAKDRPIFVALGGAPRHTKAQKTSFAGDTPVASGEEPLSTAAASRRSNARRGERRTRAPAPARRAARERRGSGTATPATPAPCRRRSRDTRSPPPPRPRVPPLAGSPRCAPRPPSRGAHSAGGLPPTSPPACGPRSTRRPPPPALYPAGVAGYPPASLAQPPAFTVRRPAGRPCSPAPSPPPGPMPPVASCHATSGPSLSPFPSAL